MVSDTQTASINVQATSVSNKALWTGRILTGVLVLFLLADGAVKFTTLAGVVQANAKIGYSMSIAPDIGVLELICTVLYLIPRTSLLGLILLTAYLGGATASHLRVGQPVFFPIVFGILLWLATYLRDNRLRACVANCASS